MNLPTSAVRRRSSLLARFLSGARAPNAKVLHTVEALESRIAPATLVTLSGGNLSVQGDQGTGIVESLVFTISGSNLHIADALHTVSSAGGGVAQNGANSVDVPLASLTGMLGVNTGAGADTVQFSATLSTLAGVSVDTGSLVLDKSITLGGSADISLTTRTSLKISGTTTKLSTQDGSLTLKANLQSSASPGAFTGIEINGATVESTGTGAVSLSGRGGTLGDSAVGILITSQAVVSGGTGSALLVQGTGGLTPDGAADGILIGGNRTVITSHGSDVQLIGTGGGTGTSTQNLGVNITGSGLVTATGGGGVSITGTGSSSASGGFNYGVGVRSGSHVTSSGGSITVLGTGGLSAGGHNDGVYLSEVADITPGGLGSVSVTGVGGSGLSAGVSLSSGVTGLAKITSSGGAVTITGTAGPGAGSTALNLLGLDSISAGNGGAVTLIGNSMNLVGAVGSASTSGVTLRPLTAGYGINLGTEIGTQLSLTDAELDRITAGLVQIGTAASGAITVSSAISQANNLALVTGAGLAVNAALSGQANLSATADQMAINGSMQAANGSVTLKPLAAGRGITLGSEVAATLSLTSAELALVNGSTVVVGAATSGSLTVSAAIAHPSASDITLASGGDILFQPGTISTGGALLLQPGGSVQPASLGTDVTTAATSALSFSTGANLAIQINGPAVHTQYQQLNVAGQVNLTGAHLQLGGAYVPAAGQSLVVVNNDGADSIQGTFNGLSEGATVVFNGVNLSLSYHGGDGNDVVLVANTTPTVTRTQSAVAVHEGQTLTNSGSFADPDATQSVNITASIGSVSQSSGASGTYTWSLPTADDFAAQTVIITATDSLGASSTTSFVIQASNVAPTPAISGPVTGLEGSAVSLTGSATDPAGANDPLTLTWTVTKNGTAYASGSGAAIDFTPDDDGAYTATLVASDDDGGTASTSQTVTVGNVAPTATISGASTANEGSSYTLNLSANDPGADAISSYTINWGDGSTPEVVSGTASSVPHLYADNGNYSISAIAADEDGTYHTNSVAVAVANVAPNLAINGAASVNEASAYTLNLAKSDPGADTISSWTINWGDGTAPELVSGALTSTTHTFADNGNYTISATATDEDGTYSSNSLGVTVTNVAPDLAISGASSSNEGSAYTLNLAKSDPGDDIVSAWTINWGDGTAPQTVSGSATSVPHTYADDGNYTISATAADEDGTYSANSLGVAVANVAPNLAISGASSANEGSAYTLNLAKSDPGADTISSWTINWGDGSAPQTVSGSVTSVPHTFADNGNYTISATAADEDGTYQANSLALAVQNVAPTLVTSGASTSTQGTSYTLSLDSTDPGADTISSWTINWGDGTAAQVVAGDPASVTHTFSSAGNFTISATATDEDGTYSANHQAVSVGSSAPTVALQTVSPINEGGSAKLTGSFTDGNVNSTHQVVITWNDPNYSAPSTFALPATSTLSPGAVVSSTDGTTLTITAVNRTSGMVSYAASHLYKDDGLAGGNGTGSDVSNITVAVKNSSAVTSSATTPVKVSNVAPVLDACGPFISGHSTSAANRADYVYLSATFADAGVLDGEKVIIDWGDGTLTDSSQGFTTSGTAVVTYNGLGGFVAGHKYATGGIFNVSYRVVDDDGGSATGTTQAWVAGVRLVPTTGELQIIGGGESDNLLINYKGDDGQGDASSANSDDKTKVTVHATLNDDCGPSQVVNTSFTAAQVKSLFISTGTGGDYVHVSNNLTVPTYLNAGSGNDTVLGGGGADVIDGGEGDDYLSGADGNDIILGGAGQDRLLAGKGNNVLSGGDGNDRLEGGSSRDVLIGGRGVDDIRGGNSSTDTAIGDLLIGGLTKNEANVEALRSILSIWSSNDTYTNIVTQLTKAGGLLEVGVQVFDDRASDALTGGVKTRDLFFADLDRLHGDDDTVTNSSSDTIKALAEILAS